MHEGVNRTVLFFSKCLNSTHLAILTSKYLYSPQTFQNTQHQVLQDKIVCAMQWYDQELECQCSGTKPLKAKKKKKKELVHQFNTYKNQLFI